MKDVKEEKKCPCEQCMHGTYMIIEKEWWCDKYLKYASQMERNRRCEKFERDDAVSGKTTPTRCHNVNPDYAGCDQFVCSNCGIELQDWHQVERDEDDGDITYHEYEFRFCPNCGARIVKEEKL